MAVAVPLMLVMSRVVTRSTTVALPRTTATRSVKVGGQSTMTKSWVWASKVRTLSAASGLMSRQSVGSKGAGRTRTPLEC